MQDRFKFRAYNKELRKMYEVDFICPYEDNHTKGGEVFLKGIQHTSFYFPEEVEVMQCIGLKDKNGKLIYEGDIVKDKYGALHPISWNVKGFYEADTFAVAGFYNAIQEDMEVIGNIYQNPELLEDKMKLEEYIKQIEVIKNEIIGCDNLMEFYRNKKNELIKELDRIQKIEIVEKED